MATNTDNRHVARQLPFQATNYLRKTVNFNDTGISTGEPFSFYLPAGAQILYATVNIITAFNAGTTNVLTVGQNSSSYNDIVASGDVAPGSTGSTMCLRGADLNITSDVQVNATYTQTGTAATAGQAVIVITYAPSNDA
jgi:hypothetical protein